jgi:hypothetical protein
VKENEASFPKYLRIFYFQNEIFKMKWLFGSDPTNLLFNTVLSLLKSLKVGHH